MRKRRDIQADYTDGELRPKRLFEAGITFSVAGVLPTIVAYAVGTLLAMTIGGGYTEYTWYRYLAYLLPQLCFAVAVYAFFRRSGEPFTAVASGCKWYYYLIAVALQFGCIAFSEVNVLFLDFLQKFLHYNSNPTPLPDMSGWNLLAVLIVIALLPPVFEEFIFRGVLVGSMRRSGWGAASTALISGALFALVHTNPAQTIYQFICGTCFALVAYRSGSMLPTVLSHVLNNAMIIIMSAAGLNDYPQAVKLPLYICSGICFAAVIAYLIFFDKNNRGQRGKAHGKDFLRGAIFGIIVCATSWLLVFLNGIFDF